MDVTVKHFSGRDIHGKIAIDIKNLCWKAQSDIREPAHINMVTDNWENKPHTLLHQIHKQKKYHDGRLFLAYYDEELIGISGCYGYNNDVILCGTRTWTLKEHRTKYVHGNYIFPAQFEWAKEKGYKEAWLTFNEYNSWLRDFLKRISSGKATAFGMKNSDTYKDLIFPEEMMNINNTEQYVAIKKL